MAMPEVKYHSIRAWDWDYVVRDGKPRWVFSGRNAKGEPETAYVTGVKPRGYVPKDQIQKMIDSGDSNFTSAEEDEKPCINRNIDHLWRFFTRLPHEVGDLAKLKDADGKNIYDTYESDIPYGEMLVPIVLGVYHTMEVPDREDKYNNVYDASEVRPAAKELFMDPLIDFIDSESDDRPFAGEEIDITNPLGAVTWISNLDIEHKEFNDFGWHPDFEDNTIKEETFKSRVQKYKDWPKEFNVRIHLYKSEVAMLHAWLDHCVSKRYNVYAGQNISKWEIKSTKGQFKIRTDMPGYDMPYLYFRCKFLDKQFNGLPGYKSLENHFKKLSPAGEVRVRWKGKEEGGSKKFDELVIVGVTVFEFLQFVQVAGVLKEFSQGKLSLTKLSKADWEAAGKPEMFEYKGCYYKFGYKRGLKNMKLSPMGEFFFNAPKVQHPKSYGEWHDKNPLELGYYCRADVEITAALHWFFKLIQDFAIRASIAGSRLIDVQRTGRPHDIVTLRRSKYRLWNKSRKLDDLDCPQCGFAGRSEEFLGKRKNCPQCGYQIKTGGYVLKPVPGRYGWTIIIDFNKLYPNIQITCNAGAETEIIPKREYEEAGIQYVVDQFGKLWKRNDLIWTPTKPKVYYRKDMVTVDVEIYNHLMGLEKSKQKDADARLEETKGDLGDPKYKILYQSRFSVKVFRNGRFGVKGMENDRASSVRVFNTDTQGASCVEHENIRFIREMGHDVIYADTDSAAVHLPNCQSLEEAKEIAEKLEKALNIHIEEFAKKEFNVEKSTLSCEAETICRSVVFFGKKKKYGMWMAVYKGKDIPMDSDASIKWKNVAGIRGETAFVADEIQDIVGRMILWGWDREAIIGYIRWYGENLKNRDWEDLFAHKSLSRPARRYKTITKTVRAHKFTKENLGKTYPIGEKFLEGEFAPMSNYPKPPAGKEFVVAFDEDMIPELKKLGFEPNWKILQRKRVLAPLKLFFEYLQIETKDVFKQQISGTADPFDF